MQRRSELDSPLSFGGQSEGISLLSPSKKCASQKLGGASSQSKHSMESVYMQLHPHPGCTTHHGRCINVRHIGLRQPRQSHAARRWQSEHIRRSGPGGGATSGEDSLGPTSGRSGVLSAHVLPSKQIIATITRKRRKAPESMAAKLDAPAHFPPS